jgi:hypothetical protein
MCRSIKTLFNFKPPATEEENPRGIVAVRAQDFGIPKAFAGQ